MAPQRSLMPDPDAIARTLVEAGCEDGWHIVNRCAAALLPLIESAMHEAWVQGSWADYPDRNPYQRARNA